MSPAEGKSSRGGCLGVKSLGDLIGVLFRLTRLVFCLVDDGDDDDDDDDDGVDDDGVMELMMME